jgi:large subunit ribosomal protein L21
MSKKDMYAIIRSGGKQYRVKKGSVIDVELLKDSLGSEVEFKDLLFVHNGDNALVGGPHVSGYVVKGEHVEVVSGPKVTSVKYIPGNHRRKFGHRQHYSRVKITEVATSK